MKLLIGLMLALLAFCAPAHAQGALVVTTCGSVPQAYAAGATRMPTVDVNGVLCGSSSTLPSGASTAANQTLEIAALNTIIAQAVPSCTAAAVVSASGESSHVLKNSGGTLCGVYATNLTATPGFLVVLNATSAPVDGAITPLACIPLQPNGVASITFGTGFGSTYSTGITAIVTSATTCFTKTTGVITAFIAGQVL